MNLVTKLYSGQVIALVVAGALLPMAIPTLASDGAVLTGTVVAADSLSPLSGARVHLSNPRTGKVHSSEPTDAEGRFTIGELAGASYELGVETDGQLFLAGTPAIVAPGQTRNVHVAIDRQTSPDEREKMEAAGLFNNPVTATLIVVGAATLIAILLEDNDEPSVTSASMP